MCSFRAEIAIAGMAWLKQGHMQAAHIAQCVGAAHVGSQGLSWMQGCRVEADCWLCAQCHVVVCTTIIVTLG